MQPHELNNLFYKMMRSVLIRFAIIQYLLVYICIISHDYLLHKQQGKKGSGTLPIETAVLASTLVGVSVECDFLDVLNAIDHDAASCESR